MYSQYGKERERREGTYGVVELHERHDMQHLEVRKARGELQDHVKRATPVLLEEKERDALHGCVAITYGDTKSARSVTVVN